MIRSLQIPKLALISLVFSLFACSAAQAQYSEYQVRSAGRRALKASLKDPGSLQIIEETITGRSYSAVFRAKNSFGGYDEDIFAYTLDRNSAKERFSPNYGESQRERRRPNRFDFSWAGIKRFFRSINWGVMCVTFFLVGFFLFVIFAALSSQKPQ